MKLKIAVLLMLFSFLFINIFFSLGLFSKKKDMIEIIGNPVSYGNEPFTYIAINTLDKKLYYIQKDYQDKIKALEFDLYHFKGYLTNDDYFPPDARYEGVFVPIEWTNYAQ